LPHLAHPAARGGACGEKKPHYSRAVASRTPAAQPDVLQQPQLTEIGILSDLLGRHRTRYKHLTVTNTELH